MGRKGDLPVQAIFDLGLTQRRQEKTKEQKSFKTVLRPELRTPPAISVELWIGARSLSFLGDLCGFA
jgi:hypothetical protein